MTTPQKTLLGIGLGAVVGLAATLGVDALAANKTATLVPPAGPADVRLIQLRYASKAGLVHVTIDACATDTVTGATDCDMAALDVNPANAQVANLYTAAINAWKTAKGY